MGGCCVSTNKAQDLKNQAKGAGAPLKATKDATSSIGKQLDAASGKLPD